MQIHNNNSNISINPDIALQNQPIAVYLDREIFLKRIQTNGTDKGLWLHWCDPRDRGQQNALRYGHCIAPNQTFDEALMQVYQAIEASIELEMAADPLISQTPDFSARSQARPQASWLNLAS